jgi:2-polyprenyl-3-methyl-5-hydroxy-6-metoxy-1,4-benzoquinol methylase
MTMTNEIAPSIKTKPLGQDKAERFQQKMIDALNGAGLALMTSIGHRTGLFDTMSRMAAANSYRIAAEAGLNERYVREWLGAMTTAGVVEHDPRDRTYRLPPEHAACLTRAATPDNLAATMQWIAVLGYVEDQVAHAFRHGRGVPYSAYRRFHEVMAEESAQTVVAGLFRYILPAAPGLVERLEDGIDVLDVGCGAGRALCAMAAAFPRSRFTGYDLSGEAIAAAKSEAAHRGLGNATFDVRDAAALASTQREHSAYDLVTAFDAIHDQARPADVLRNIRAALRPGGIFIMQDILAHSHHHENVNNPLGTFIYTISCMHCMSVSLASGGPGLGAAWGRQKALEMLHSAGFAYVRVERLDHDAMNYYYFASPERPPARPPTTSPPLPGESHRSPSKPSERK